MQFACAFIYLSFSIITFFLLLPAERMDCMRSKRNTKLKKIVSLTVLILFLHVTTFFAKSEAGFQKHYRTFTVTRFVTSVNLTRRQMLILVKLGRSRGGSAHGSGASEWWLPESMSSNFLILSLPREDAISILPSFHNMGTQAITLLKRKWGTSSDLYEPLPYHFSRRCRIEPRSHISLPSLSLGVQS